MARVWRPGQQKKVYLYRILCTGTIEGTNTTFSLVSRLVMQQNNEIE
jgi:hypothetical protein